MIAAGLDGGNTIISSNPVTRTKVWSVSIVLIKDKNGDYLSVISIFYFRRYGFDPISM